MGLEPSKRTLELRQTWLGKTGAQPGGDDADTALALADASDAPPAAASTPYQRTAAALAGVPAEPATRKSKEMRELSAYLKQLTAKTNLLDLTHDVLSDKRLRTYGWMMLGVHSFRGFEVYPQTRHSLSSSL